MDLRWAFFFSFLAVPIVGDTSSNKARSCSDVRHFYSGKGFPLSGVPQTEISGEHLRICPQGYTCCTSDMEERLSNLSRHEFEALVQEAGRSLQLSLSTQHTNFNGHFLELLNRSERSLQEAFPTVYGELYTQNARIFLDLYGELRRYYRGSNSINLEEALNEFWVRLLERLFKALNPQYVIGDDYLECVVKQTEKLRPFGEVPRDLKLKATRAFIAARSFVQGLWVSSEVVRKVSQVPLSSECIRAIMKLMYCPHCRGMPSVKPCTNYCKNVMKGCLANQADLDTEWQNLVDAMNQVADRFNGPSSVEVVIGSIHTRISEAMGNMQENSAHFTSKVFQACGEPRVGGTRSSGAEEKRKRVKNSADDKSTISTGMGLEKLVMDVTGKLREMQQYWVQLPSAMCNDKVAAGVGNEDKCWNGINRGRYLPEVMGDGLASQINNPEVEIDITKPDMTIRQQIMQLKIMTNRLRNAFNGNDVDFQDTSDDVSGSGSATCPEDLCPRGSGRIAIPNTDRPKLYAIPPENKKVTDNSGSQNLPCTALLLLLSLATLLLRR
ncbi:glypican-1 [Amia ocellicauda]|uniref:glypican-1 n=1 Tax=Amia ocellicauda TaxID=2972642 RepID=UPI0034639830